MYVREVNGQPATFAVSGQLWKESLVMHDVGTRSLWSQMQGEAKLGALKGQRLERLPAVLTDWATWARQHPDGTVAWLPYTGGAFRRQALEKREKYVIGIAAEGAAKAWGFEQFAATPVINDTWNDRPVLVVFPPDASGPSLYERRLGSRLLTFSWSGTQLRDEETESAWEAATGRAIGGPLMGERLAPLPGLVSYRTAWKRFYPHSAGHRGEP